MRKALAAVCLLLAGCTGEPSESEMRTAVEAYTRVSLGHQGKTFHEFLDFRKQGCIAGKTKAGEFDCYYAAVIPPTGPGQSVPVNGKGRFHRDDHKNLIFEDLGAQPR